MVSHRLSQPIAKVGTSIPLNGLGNEISNKSEFRGDESMEENNKKYEKGTLGWLREQAKKDGFDDLGKWNEWKREQLSNIEKIRRQKEIDIVNNRGIEEKVWSKIRKKGEDDCWLWTGSKTPSGYGRIYINGETIRANRLVYILTKGFISEDKIILHTCNNKLCVNPKHLKEGTNLENSQQMVEDGRQVSGNTILTKENVSKIRELYNTGKYSYEILSDKFGITKGNTVQIIRNELWKDKNYKRLYGTNNQE